MFVFICLLYATLFSSNIISGSHVELGVTNVERDFVKCSRPGKLVVLACASVSVSVEAKITCKEVSAGIPPLGPTPQAHARTPPFSFVVVVPTSTSFVCLCTV